MVSLSQNHSVTVIANTLSLTPVLALATRGDGVMKKSNYSSVNEGILCNVQTSPESPNAMQNVLIIIPYPLSKF